MIIRNAHCALPGEEHLLKRDVRIEGERITAISKHLEPKAGEAEVDASGLELFPGAIDPHVHFDEPGFTHREDFTHGSMAAARGGVTTVIDMPCTSLPPVTTVANLKEKVAAMGNHSVVDYALFAGIAGNHLEQALAEDMEALAPHVVGYKCYFVSGMDTFTAVDHYGFGRAAAKAAQLGRPLLLHAEDAGTVLPATKAMHERSNLEGREPSWDDYVDSRPEEAELAAVAGALASAGRHASSVHIVHVGTASAAVLAATGLPGIEAINPMPEPQVEAEMLGNPALPFPPPVPGTPGGSCETCPHYLAFNREDFADKGSSLKTAPPVKSREQAELLWRLLEDGTISFVASDHAPAPEAEKNTGSPWTDYGGIPGTGTLFPYVYSQGYKAGRLSLKSFLRAVSGAAAARYGLAGRKGALAVGMDADLVLIDPKAKHVVKGKELLSKGTITPFEGMSLDGRILATLVRGRLVWDGRKKGSLSGLSSLSGLDAAASGQGTSETTGAASDGRIVAPLGHGKQLTWGYK
jgi:dihydroorotase-like cyclic amidohydrolase